MSDREMLELAAKAAGYGNAKYQDLRGWGEVRYGLAEAIWTGEDYWNPITDDGDALRLAVELRLMDEVSVMNSQYESVNPLAATRRAIVRAAAGIGRQMP